MNKIEGFQEFLATQSVQLPVLGFLFNLVLAALLATLLAIVYQRFGSSFGNRKAFSKNFVLLAMTTMFVIAIVKSSLALSLGLVGALSIVRFRAAIKEPEELMFLFLAISIGLGLGADQRLITLLAFTVILLLIIASRYFNRSDTESEVQLQISLHKNKKLSFEKILKLLEKECEQVALRRLSDNGEMIEYIFEINVKGSEEISNIKNELSKVEKTVRINFLSNKV